MIIGITGRAGSGKDTLAQMFVDELGFERHAFADKMREALLALDPLVTEVDRLAEIVERNGWDAAKRQIPEVRRLLQAFGTEAGRNIHGEDCWVDATLGAYRLLWSNEARLKWVISDVRFDNEAQAIKDSGGRVIRIERPGLEPLEGDQPSEQGVSDKLVNTPILNDGTIDLLRAKLRRIGWVLL